MNFHVSTTPSNRSENPMSLATTTDATFDQEVLRSPSPVLVKFTADWCPPCFMVAPVLDRIATDEADRLKVVSVDYDLNPEISQRYHVLGLPTMALFSQGEMVARIVGAKPRAAIMRELEPHLAPR